MSEALEDRCVGINASDINGMKAAELVSFRMKQHRTIPEIASLCCASIGVCKNNQC